MPKAQNSQKPVMLYDADCGFCLHWVKRWEKMTRGRIEYAPYQTARVRFPDVSEEACKKAIQLIMPDGSVTAGAHAVFKSLDSAGIFRFPHWLYEHVLLFDSASEFVYQWIAHHRFILSKLFIRGSSINKCG